MTTKLTLTIDDSVINAAKKYARKKGNSLSDIVENYLKSITTVEEAPVTLSPKVKKLMGVIKLPDDFDYKKELGNALSKKYS
ncbi:DUF6364 family protein [Mucilaginibacter flavus]|uniref:DUF6364 family protein n=1 Tax=Mucilaginibacter flavus TaxID=931504 RepID=UPI0025B4D27D|nr:DUF6364 family protein [Mucilaginibacter flavus]MDN3581453.1 DUF6364 family protein [Mucilaginibacter flavus]